MNYTETKLQYNVCEKNENGIPVIIVAAGNSTRMKGVDKQFLSIMGIPVIARTLMAFEACQDIFKIIIVTARDSILNMQQICQTYNISKVTDIIEGGSNRHKSVMNGISRLNCEDKKVLIHDGARPFVSVDIISAVANALNDFDAALCVCKINDTVKNVDENGLVTSTVDRTTLYAAQTPQGVDVIKYKNACENIALVDSLTDDASVMEAAGFTVKAIIGNGKNIKITTPEDIVIAESLVKGETEV